jgi:hypothetical protein
MDKRQLVVQRNLLCAQDLLQAHGADRAGLDARVGRHHHALRAGDRSDAGNDAGAGETLGRVRMVHAESGQCREFEKSTARIEQQGQALARQQLPTFFEQGSGLGRTIARALRQQLHVGQRLRHVCAVAYECVGLRLDAGVDDRHGVR